jgi:RimJ/RimL family protein N-acetyltransferase
LPQTVALRGEQVVGYCLCMAPSMRATIPELAPMFDQFDRMRYRGRVLAEWDYVVGGQVCVELGYRGRGLVGDLYRSLRQRLPGLPELCVTEIAVRNEISRRAHYRIGFEAVERYRDHAEHWEVVAWAWQQDRAER